MTATVDRIDKFSRTLTLRRDNASRNGHCRPVGKLFDELDRRRSVRYTDSVVVQVRPGLRSAFPRIRLALRRHPTTGVSTQLKTVVTIDTIDPDGQFVIYRTEDGLKAMRTVADKKLLQGIRQEDRVEITLTRERAVNIQRAK